MISQPLRAGRGLRAASLRARLREAIPVLLLLIVASCSRESANTSQPAKPTDDSTVPPVARRAIPEAAVAPRLESQSIAPLPPPEAAIIVPPGVQYVCVTNSGGQPQQTAIEFSPQVAQLCIKNPEMGPCQYERNACRRGGGRVYGGDGKEITVAMEAEYDKKVMRVRLKSN
jgi:hypothetical protein